MLSPKRDICVNSPPTQRSRTVIEEDTEGLCELQDGEEGCEMLISRYDMATVLTATVVTQTRSSQSRF